MYIEVECRRRRLFPRLHKFHKNRSEMRKRRRRRIARFFVGRHHRHHRRHRHHRHRHDKHKLALEIGELLYMRERQMQNEIGCQCDLLRHKRGWLRRHPKPINKINSKKIKLIKNPILATRLAKSNPLLASKILDCDKGPDLIKQRPIQAIRRKKKCNRNDKIIIIKPIINLPPQQSIASTPCTGDVGGGPVQEELRRDLLENPQLINNAAPSILLPPIFRPNMNVIPKRMTKIVTTDMLGVDGLDALDVYK